MPFDLNDFLKPKNHVRYRYPTKAISAFINLFIVLVGLGGVLPVELRLREPAFLLFQFSPDSSNLRIAKFFAGTKQLCSKNLSDTTDSPCSLSSNSSGSKSSPIQFPVPQLSFGPTIPSTTIPTTTLSTISAKDLAGAFVLSERFLSSRTATTSLSAPLPGAIPATSSTESADSISVSPCSQ